MESVPKLAYPEEDSGPPSELPRDDVEALLEASNKAQEPLTALEYAQRAMDVLPDDPQVQQTVQRSVFSNLNEDAFVAFLAETDKHYVITFRNARPVIVAKARTKPEIFPVSDRTKGERGEAMLWWLLLGLLPVGIGALILSPLILGYALDVLWRNEPVTTPAAESAMANYSREKRLAWVTIFVAIVLGFLGMFFALLLVLHLIG